MFNSWGGLSGELGAALPPDGSLPSFIYESENMASMSDIRSSRSLDDKVTMGGVLFTVQSAEMSETGVEGLQPPAERTQVWVDSLAVQTVNDEIIVTIAGNFPDSCSTLGEVETTVDGDAINVTVFADSPPDMMCASVLVPFEETITLDVGEIEPGEYTVIVNESATATLTVN